MSGRSPRRPRRTRWSNSRRPVAAHYGGQNPEIEVRQLAGLAAPPPGAAQPLERQIVVAEGPDAGVSLYGPGPIPALLITGPVSELTNQTRLITSAIARCVGLKAVPGPLIHAAAARQRDHHPPARSARRERLRAEPQVGVNLDQTRLGRPVRDVQVHLIGSYATARRDRRGRWWSPSAARPSPAGRPSSERPGGPLGRGSQFDAAAPHDAQRAGEHRRQHGPMRRVPAHHADDRRRERRADHFGRTAGADRLQSLPQGPDAQGAGRSATTAASRTPRGPLLIMTGLRVVGASHRHRGGCPLADALKSPSPAVLISPDGWDHPELPLKVTAPDTVPTTLNVVDDDGNPTTLTLQPGVRFGFPAGGVRREAVDPGGHLQWRCGRPARPAAETGSTAT